MNGDSRHLSAPVDRAVAAGHRYATAQTFMVAVTMVAVLAVLGFVGYQVSQASSTAKTNRNISAENQSLLRQINALVAGQAADRSRNAQIVQEALAALAAQGATDNKQVQADLEALLRAIESGSPTITFPTVAPVSPSPSPSPSATATHPSSMVTPRPSSGPTASHAPTVSAPPTASATPIPITSTLTGVLCSVLGVVVPCPLSAAAVT